MAFCSKCGAEIDNNQPLCAQCSSDVQKKNNSINNVGADLASGRRNKWIAIIFAFFFGSFGIHKFYLGQIGWGITYLLFCWTGIPGIVGIVEAVLYLTMSDEEFAKKYSK